MANSTSMVTSSVITANSQHKRDFAERIRRLYDGATKICALVDGTNLDAWGKVKYSGNGMIKKEAASRMDPEFATYTPIDQFKIVTADGTTTVDVDDTTGFEPGGMICNTRTGDVAIILDLTSTTRLTVVAITGTSFSVQTGDTITTLANTFEEGTSRYHTITNELTINKTYLQIFREGVGIADTVRNTPQYTNEGMLERYMTDKTMQAMRRLEASLLFSKQATSGTTSSTLVGTGDAGTYSLYSMKGLVPWSGAAFPMNGTLSWETFNTVLYPIMPRTMNSKETVYALMGRKLAGVMNQWANNHNRIIDNGDEKFGVKVRKYLMGGALEIEPLVHEQFDNGNMQNTIVFFQSGDLVYRFMKGMDLKVRENAQLPATMGKVDIIEGVVGLQSNSAGAAIKVVTDCLPS